MQLVGRAREVIYVGRGGDRSWIMSLMVDFWFRRLEMDW